MRPVNLCGRSSTSHGMSSPRYLHTPLFPDQIYSSNHVPWAILAACSLASAVLILALRFLLAAENKRRNAEQPDEKYDDAYLTDAAGGKAGEARVDKVSKQSVYTVTRTTG